jgi:hypothetical protein
MYICSAIKKQIKGKTRRSKLLGPDRLDLMIGELRQAAHVHVSVSNATIGKGSNTAAQTIYRGGQIHVFFLDKQIHVGCSDRLY